MTNTQFRFNPREVMLDISENIRKVLSTAVDCYVAGNSDKFPDSLIVFAH